MIAELRTDRLLLRPVRDIDIGMRHGLLSNPKETSLFGSDPPKNLQATRKHVLGLINMNQTGFSYHWTIEMLDRPHPVGFFDAYPPFPHLLPLKIRELSCGLDGEFRGQGVMTEALSTGIDFILRRENICRLEAIVSGDNVKSIALFERLGFKFEGVQRKKWVWQNERHDMRSYSLLVEDWAGYATAA